MGWLTGWNANNRFKITVDQTKIDDNLTNHPLLIYLSNACGQTNYDASAFFTELKPSSTNDTFTGSDGSDPDPDRWYGLEYGTSAVQILGNQSRHTTASGNARMYSNIAIDGDFDIQVDYSINTGPASNVWTAWLRAEDYFNDLRFSYIARAYNSGHKYLFCDTGCTEIFLSHTNGKLRLTRSGNTFHAYYDSSGWVEIGTGRTNSTINKLVKIQLGVTRSTTNPTAIIDFDNFTINSGNWFYTNWNRKIAVTTSDGTTEIPACIVSRYQEAIIYAKVPSISSSLDTVLYLYFDKTQSNNANIEDITSVTTSIFDSDTQLVLLTCQGAAIVNGIKDVTTYNNDLTFQGADGSNTIDGDMLNILTFNGTNEYIYSSVNTPLNPTTFTLEAYINVIASNGLIIYLESSDSDRYFSFSTVVTDLRLRFGAGTSPTLVGTSNTNLSTGTWYHLAMSYSPSDGLRFYLNGAADGTASYIAPTGQVGKWRICGNTADAGWLTALGIADAYLNANVQEVRVSHVVRSAAYLLANTYALQDNLNTYVVDTLASELTATLPQLTAAMSGGVTLGSYISAELPSLTGGMGGGYFIGVTLPFLQASMDITSEVSELTAALPLLTATAQLSSGEIISLNVSLPQFTISALMSPHIDIFAQLPLLQSDITILPGISVEIDTSLPLLTAKLEVVQVETMTITAALPLLTMQSNFAGKITAVLPLFTDEINIVTGHEALIEAILPILTGSFNLLRGEIGQLDVTLPKIQSVITTAELITGDITAILPKLQSAFEGVTGYLASIEATLPLLTSQISAVVNVSGDIDVQLPSWLSEIVFNTIMTETITSEEFPYLVMVMNILNNDVSFYTHHKFNSYAKFNLKYYALAPDGLYELGGDTADGQIIISNLRTGLVDFRQSEVKRIFDNYLTMSGDGSYDFLTSVNDTEVVYRFDHDEAQMSTAKVNMAKGCRGRFWEFGFNNIEGSDFNVENFAFNVVLADRKIKHKGGTK
jgi:hypothetical protein